MAATPKNIDRIPKGFVLHWVHQCPENPRAPHASLKWLATLKEDVFKGRSYRGKAIYYDTPEAALDGAIAEVERILENRLKRKRPAAT